MKKTIAVILIIIIINLTLANIVSAIDFGFPQSLQELQTGIDINNFNSVLDSGEVSVSDENGTKSVKNKVESKEGGNNTITKIICRILIAAPTFVNYVLANIVEDKVFTIQETVSNKYDLFKIDYLINGEPVSEKASKDTKSIIEKMKKNVAIWFVSIRNISLVGSVLTLIYVAIRVSIASVSTEKSKYKEMAMSWLEGIALLLLLQFIIVIAINLSSIFCNLIIKFMGTETGTNSLEQSIMEEISDGINQAIESGHLLAYLVLFTVLTYYELKFFIIYLYRMLRISFFIIISPLICLIYPIDKVGDGKPQSFDNWIREFLIAVFIQPIHLLIYIIFIASAGEIFMRSPLLGVIFLGSLSHGETIVKQILNIQPSLSKGIEDVELLGEK